MATFEQYKGKTKQEKVDKIFDVQATIDDTSNEIRKETSKRPGPLKTTRAAGKRGPSDQGTMFTLGDIVQGIPALSNPVETLERFADILFGALGQADAVLGKGRILDIADGMFLGLIPEDAKRTLQYLQEIHAQNKTEPDLKPFTEADKQVAESVITHPNIRFRPNAMRQDAPEPDFVVLGSAGGGVVGSNVPAQMRAGKISPNILKALKILADSCPFPIWVNRGYTPNSYVATGNEENPNATNILSFYAHGMALSVNFGDAPKADYNGSPEMLKCFQVLDSILGAERPTEVAGAWDYKPNFGNGKDRHGTYWFTGPTHLSHVYFANSVWAPPVLPDPAPAPGTPTSPPAPGGGTTPTAPSTGGGGGSTATGPLADRFISACRAEIGYRETGGNGNKFAAMAGHGAGQAWCASFLVAMARSVGLKISNESAYTPTLADGFRKTNSFDKNPRKGDIVFFDFPDSVHRIQHVGVLVSWTSSTVTTIDGNTGGPGGGADGVFEKTRNISNVVGFGHPSYPAAPASGGGQGPNIVR